LDGAPGVTGEEPGAGKPHARTCEGKAEWPSSSTTSRRNPDPAPQYSCRQPTSPVPPSARCPSSPSRPDPPPRQPVSAHALSRQAISFTRSSSCSRTKRVEVVSEPRDNRRCLWWCTCR
jgi:hypothetical protein